MKKSATLIIASLVAIAILALPVGARAGDVVNRVYDTWTTAAGTSLTAGLWDHWTIDKIEFVQLNPTNTAMTATVRYVVSTAFTCTVGSVTGSLTGTGSLTPTNAYMIPGDVLWLVPGGASTGKVVVTYRKQNP